MNENRYRKDPAPRRADRFAQRSESAEEVEGQLEGYFLGINILKVRLFRKF